MRLDPITLISQIKVLCQGLNAIKTGAAMLPKLIRLYELVLLLEIAAGQKVKPDDHSEVVPLLPIPNRTVKRLCADDSADSRVKVGHRQAVILRRPVGNDGAFSSVLQLCAKPAGALMRTRKVRYNVSLR